MPDDVDTVEEFIAIGQRVQADPRYKRLRAAMVHRIRAYTRTLITNPLISDDEYFQRTTDYDLKQFTTLGRKTEFLYAQARAALAATGQLGAPTTDPGTAAAVTPTGSIHSANTGSWSDEVYQDPWYLAARSAMAARIRHFDLSLIDDPAISDEEFYTRSSDYGYQQARQLLIDTINTLSTGSQPA